ncbi:MAG: hypothetical protein V2I33_03410 [Kangiellaceae bacterium]|jgi:hypothetical protein|nr:hypothetical protein [Kangiellaceae bacterium]
MKKSTLEHPTNATSRHLAKLALATLAWVLSTAVCAFGPKFIWHGDTTVSVMAIIINVLVGLLMVKANVEHLKSTDELQQKIQLDAMGITLGIGLVCGIAYSMLDISNVIASDAEIGHLIIVMSITYLASILIGHARYR